MEELIRELIIKNKSISIIETENLKSFGTRITQYESLGAKIESFRVKNVSTSPKGASLINQRRNVNAKYAKDSAEKACDMARIASEFNGSDFGVGICGNLGLGNSAYIGIYDRLTNSVNPIVITFDIADKFQNKARILLMVKAWLIMRLNTMPNPKKTVATKTKTVQKQGR